MNYLAPRTAPWEIPDTHHSHLYAPQIPVYIFSVQHLKCHYFDCIERIHDKFVVSVESIAALQDGNEKYHSLYLHQPTPTSAIHSITVFQHCGS